MESEQPRGYGTTCWNGKANTSIEGKSIGYVRLFRRFSGLSNFNNLGRDIGGSVQKQIRSQDLCGPNGHNLAVERCLLMSTDPGDLVFDPTCGSGTTAYAAEQWGRRWITCDTSRVATTLAKQRLMGATFDYYKLAHPNEGVGSGFEYKKVPHVTLKSIANNEPPGEETLYDQPLVDNSRARISGPFTVEAVPAPNVKSIDDLDAGPGKPSGKQEALGDFRHAATPLLDASIARSGPTIRQSDWRDELLKTGIRGKGGQMINFSRVEPLGGTRWLHADAETKGVKPERVVISFWPGICPAGDPAGRIRVGRGSHAPPQARNSGLCRVSIRS